MNAPAPKKLTPIARRGLMLVISSPSGAGKSTISRALMEDDPTLGMSVSVTTRQRRPSEIAGRLYHFISIREFERMRDSDALLEWAEVHGNFYGTPREPVEIAIFARAPGAKEKDEKVLFTDKRRVSGSDPVITITVKDKPFEVGVDPYNKMIDRVPRDNRKEVTFN